MKNSDKLFIECVGRINRYPRVDAISFPKLPNKCYFVLCPPADGRWKIDVNGRIYTYEDYKKVKNKGAI